MNNRAYAIFVDDDSVFHLLYGTISDRTFMHLDENPPAIDGNTHLARFSRGDGPSHGKLENVMPGSTFTHFTFERHDFGSKQDPITVFVGWYWTEDE